MDMWFCPAVVQAACGQDWKCGQGLFLRWHLQPGKLIIQEVGHDSEERRIQRLNLKVQLSTGQGWLGDRWYPREKVVQYNIRETQDDSLCDD